MFVILNDCSKWTMQVKCSKNRDEKYKVIWKDGDSLPAPPLIFSQVKGKLENLKQSTLYYYDRMIVKDALKVNLVCVYKIIGMLICIA